MDREHAWGQIARLIPLPTRDEERDQIEEEVDLVAVAAGDMHEFKRLIELVEILDRRRQVTTTPRNPVAHMEPPQLSDYEVQRAQAIAEHLAVEAASLRPVRSFRAAMLGHEHAVLSFAEALAFLGSPALGFLSQQDFVDSGIPMQGHRSEITLLQPETAGEDPSSPEHRITIEWPGKTGDQVVNINVSEELIGAKQRVDVNVPGSSPPRVIDAYEGSVFSGLLSVAKWLADRYPWSLGAAAWYLLTGHVPEITPLLTTITSDAYDRSPRITITAEPWVSLDSVARAFRHAQRHALGGESRPLGARGLTLFRFVTALHGGGSRPPWRTMMEQWNNEYPDWRYDDVRRFSRDWRRVQGVLFGLRSVAPPDEEPAGQEGAG